MKMAGHYKLPAVLKFIVFKMIESAKSLVVAGLCAGHLHR